MRTPEDIKPIGAHVLIKVNTVDDKSEGGMFIPDTVRDRDQYAHDMGILVAKSFMAYADFEGDIPEVGDEVLYSKYSGSLLYFRTPEGRTQYRLCEDKDVKAVIGKVNVQ